MVWGRMSPNGVGKIDFLKWSINAAVYQDVHDHFLIPYIENKFGDNELIFQHDLANSAGRRGYLFFIELCGEHSFSSFRCKMDCSYL